MPGIQGAQEAKIGRIVTEGQPVQKGLKTPCQSIVACPFISAMWETDIRKIPGKSYPSKNFTRPYFNIKIWLWRHAPLIPATSEKINRRLQSRLAQGKK
jgi:hypothetical protein